MAVVTHTDLIAHSWGIRSNMQRSQILTGIKEKYLQALNVKWWRKKSEIVSYSRITEMEEVVVTEALTLTDTGQN